MGSTALCHTDLHERQIICRRRRLAALIDFGDATIADPRWDFGSILYFHGPRVLEAALGGYSSDSMLRQKFAADAGFFSAGIALHHAYRSATPGRAHRLGVAVAHLRGLLRSE